MSTTSEPSPHAGPGKRPRDLRLDVFRGAGMFIILFAHIPWNGWADWIPARFGFSDAAEIFVFCSGVASSIAFGRVFDRAGLALGTARIAHRMWQVYWAHIAVFVATVALMAAADHVAGADRYLRQELNLGPFLDDPGMKLLGLATLTYVPNYFDILPMYLVVLALVPAVMGLHRFGGTASVAAAVVGLWGVAAAGLLELPAETWSGRPWFFNPFSWQLVFFTGFVFGRGWLRPPPLDRRLVWASAIALCAAAPFSCQYGFSCYAAWGSVPWLGEAHRALAPLVDKTHVGALRFVHFLALAYLAYQLAGEGGRRLASPGFDIVRLVGRQTLAVFLAGLWLAQALGILLDVVGRTAATVALANIGGCALLVLVAAIVEWAKGAPWSKPRTTPVSQAGARDEAERRPKPRSVAGPAAALCAALAVAGSAGPARGGEVLFGRTAPSPTLGHDIPYVLYRPAAAPPSGQRWPVLYLLHGLGDTERAWTELGHAEETLDRLIGERRIKPLLVVMPMAGRSWYVDNPDPGGDGLMAQAFDRDLIAHVDSVEPTAACRQGRAIGGLSMGGYGALLYAMDHPRRYGAAFSLSGSLFQPMPDSEAERGRRTTRMFGDVFGTPFDWRRFNRWNLFLKLPDYIGDRDRTPFYLAVGDQDFPGLQAGNAAFRAALAQAGIEVPFRVDPGGHVWSLWSAQLGPSLEWIDGFLRSACP